MTQRILNVKPSPPAEIAVEQRATFVQLDIPPGRTVVPMIPPRSDQGSLGTCIAHMARNLYQHHHKEKYGRFAAIGIDQINAFYDLCTKVEGRSDPERLDGLWPVTAFRVMRGSGFPIGGGRGPHITGFEYVGATYADVRRSIVQFNDPVGVALAWDAAWMVCSTNKVLRAPVGQVIGGHGFTAFVRDDAYQTVGAVEGNANSWGLDWGPNGTFYLKDEYLLDRWVEAWRIKGIE